MQRCVCQEPTDAFPIFLVKQMIKIFSLYLVFSEHTTNMTCKEQFVFDLLQYEVQFYK